MLFGVVLLLLLMRKGTLGVSGCVVSKPVTGQDVEHGLELQCQRRKWGRTESDVLVAVVEREEWL